MKFYLVADVKEGDIFFNKERHAHIIENLFDGRYIISYQKIDPKSTVKEYRACYFFKIDAIAAEVGETRYVMHEYVKEMIIEQMIDQTPELFTKQLPSTKYLTLEGWVNLLERLDIWAFTEYNVVLQ